MRRVRVLVLVTTVVLGVAAPSLAVGTSLVAPRQADQGIPEYGLVVSAIAGGFLSAKPIFTCSTLGLTAITEALEGPAGVQKLGTELVAEALGSPKKPWPKNTRAFAYQGRRHVPDFVKGHSLYDVDTSKRLELTPEIRDQQAIARRQGGDLVIVTRRKTSISPALTRASSKSAARRTGRIRIVRCI